jgi:hypothetical protein
VAKKETCMQLVGEKLLAAPPDRVWAALIDPDFLKALIPGCQSMTGDPETGYDITVERNVGGMAARLSGRFDLSEVEPGRGCVLTGSGRRQASPPEPRASACCPSKKGRGCPGTSEQSSAASWPGCRTSWSTWLPGRSRTDSWKGSRRRSRTVRSKARAGSAGS